VPIKLISSFKRIKALTPDPDVVVAALRSSTRLVVDEAGRRVRRAAPLTEVDHSAVARRIVVAEHLGPGPTIGAGGEGRGGEGKECKMGRPRSVAGGRQGTMMLIPQRAAWVVPRVPPSHVASSPAFVRRPSRGSCGRPRDAPRSPASPLLALHPAPDSVAASFSKYGKVELVRICPGGQTQKLPAWLASAVAGMACAEGAFALVEFGTEEEAARAVEGARNPDNW
jgi:hypothetical protein